MCFKKWFKKSTAVSNVDPRIACNTSKQELCANITEQATRIGDEDVRDLLIKLRTMIEGFRPCGDVRAISLDNKIKVMLSDFQRNMFKLNTRGMLDDNITEQETQFKREANRRMFKECWDVMEKQLDNREALMYESVKTDKEIAAMDPVLRTDYQKEIIAREQSDQTWDIEFAALGYNLKLYALRCERQCVQIKMDRLLDEVIADPSITDSNLRKVTQLERQLDSINDREKRLNAEIDTNDQVKAIIDNNALTKNFGIINADSGLGMGAKTVAYGEAAKAVTEIHQADMDRKTAGIVAGRAAHGAIAPKGDQISSSAKERLADRQVSQVSAMAGTASSGNESAQAGLEARRAELAARNGGK